MASFYMQTRKLLIISAVIRLQVSLTGPVIDLVTYVFHKTRKVL